MKIRRKEFLKALGISGAGLVLGTPHAMASARKKSKSVLVIGLASYTFREFSLDETIAYAKRLGFDRIALKSMHMPLEATPDAISAAAKKVRDAGLDLYGAGVITMKTEADVNQAFDYARHARLRTLISSPLPELLPLIDKKVKEYDVQLAIHNHGPEDKVWPGPEDIYEKVKGLDKRIGLCIDIGHTTRLGKDPAAMAIKCKDRLFDTHMKDLDASNKNIEVGRGKIDIPGYLKALLSISYQGSVSFEYEKDGDDPMAGLAESVGFVRGVLRMV